MRGNRFHSNLTELVPASQDTDEFPSVAEDEDEFLWTFVSDYACEICRRAYYRLNRAVGRQS